MRNALLLTALLAPHTLLAAPTASSAPAQMPVLRTGERKVIDHGEVLKTEVVSHAVDGGAELFSVRLPPLDVAQPDSERTWYSARSEGGGGALAFQEGDVVWLRRAATDAGRGLTGDVYVGDASSDTAPSHHFRFSVAGSTSHADPAVGKAFAAALSSWFERTHRTTPFTVYAAQKLVQKAGGDDARAAAVARRGNRGELERLMQTTTGMASIQEAIQSDRPLWLAAGKEKQTVPLAKVKAPPLAAHPFSAMLAALGKVGPEEKLAASVPAEFYYLRAKDFDVLFKIVDQIDAWGTPVLNVIETRGEDHAVTQRTLTQLGLERGPLARALGTQVVADLAVVGSDPYVREGSDVTLLFRVKQKAMFDLAVASATRKHLETHGAAGDKTVDVNGVPVHVVGSSDGAVRQHRASVGDIEIVSNSLAATRRVLAAISGKAPRLADEPDLRYMLARGGNRPSDVFMFMGDRFVAEVIGPRQKILEARRILASTELLVPGYAALLYGWLEGRAPQSVDDLIRAGLLKREELKHVGWGGDISFQPGRGARSAWGAPGALEPLIDLPSPTLVTESERVAYARFAESYQYAWRQYIDPIAVRIDVVPGDKGETRFIADLRVLPLIDGTDYRRLNEMVGKARITVPQLVSGLRTTLGIGADAHLRREATQVVGRSPFGGQLTLDWLGDWLFFGVDDRPEVANMILTMDPRAVPQAPGGPERIGRRFDSQIDAALHAPLYLGVAIRSVVGATVALTAIRKLVLDAAPGVVDWSEQPQYKGNHVVRIAVAPSKISKDSTGASIFYSLTDGVFLASFSERTLKSLLDERTGKRVTDAAEPNQADAPQFVLHWASAKGAPLNQILGWFLESMGLESSSRSRSHAETLLRGAPGMDVRAAGFAYEGAEPIPVDGGQYTLGPDGVRDAARGSRVLEKWPQLPVKGSAVERLLAAVAGFRGEVSFDDEPRVAGSEAMHSLHVKVELSVR